MTLKPYTPPVTEAMAILFEQNCLQAVSGGEFGGNGEAGSGLTEDNPFNL